MPCDGEEFVDQRRMILDRDVVMSREDRGDERFQVAVVTQVVLRQRLVEPRRVARVGSPIRLPFPQRRIGVAVA